jgi:hypothetical protein
MLFIDAIKTSFCYKFLKTFLILLKTRLKHLVNSIKNLSVGALLSEVVSSENAQVRVDVKALSTLNTNFSLMSFYPI